MCRAVLQYPQSAPPPQKHFCTPGAGGFFLYAARRGIFAVGSRCAGSTGVAVDSTIRTRSSVRTKVFISFQTFLYQSYGGPVSEQGREKEFFYVLDHCKMVLSCLVVFAGGKGRSKNFRSFPDEESTIFENDLSTTPPRHSLSHICRCILIGTL